MAHITESYPGATEVPARQRPAGMMPLHVGEGVVTAFKSGGGNCVGLGRLTLGSDGETMVIPILDTKDPSDKYTHGFPQVGELSPLALAARVRLGIHHDRVAYAPEPLFEERLGAVVLGSMARHFDSDELAAFTRGVVDFNFKAHLDEAGAAAAFEQGGLPGVYAVAGYAPGEFSLDSQTLPPILVTA
jgi:hypothetical protein